MPENRKFPLNRSCRLQEMVTEPFEEGWQKLPSITSKLKAEWIQTLRDSEFGAIGIHPFSVLAKFVGLCRPHDERNCVTNEDETEVTIESIELLVSYLTSK